MTKHRTYKPNRVTSADAPIVDSNVTVKLPGKPRHEAALPVHEQPRAADVAAIRDLAHHKWEAAGRPAGDGLQFWLEAEREFNAERTEATASSTTTRQNGSNACET